MTDEALRTKLLSCLFLTVLTVALFSRAAGGDFIDYDDLQYVVDNPHVNSGFSIANVLWAFSSGYASNWHPVTWLSHMMDVEIFSLDPRGHHVVNLVLHALNSSLLFLLLHKLTGAHWRSLTVAVFFAVHPLHVESVAWVAERKDLLSTCFGILALTAYCGYARSGKRGYYCLLLLLFALSLMSKPMLVTLPFLLLLLDYWPLRRLQSLPLSRLLVEKIPLFALSVLSSWVTVMVQSKEAVHSLALTPPVFRLCNALVSYLRYLWKALLPQDLSVLYPLPRNIPVVETVGSASLLLLVSVAVLALSRKRPYLVVGWFWFLGTLVPVIGIVQVGLQSMADRYTYFPLTGIFIAAVWGLSEIAERRTSLKSPLAVTAVVAAIAWSCVTWNYLGCWVNGTALFSQALATTSHNYYAHYLLGNAYRAEHLYHDALMEYDKARRIEPRFAEACINTGIIHAKLGKQEEAVEDFQAALAVKPDSPYVHYNLALALQKQGRLADAVQHYLEVLRRDPVNVESHFNAGLALMSLKRYREAIGHFREVLKLRPDLNDARTALQMCGG